MLETDREFEETPKLWSYFFSNWDSLESQLEAAGMHVERILETETETETEFDFEKESLYGTQTVIEH